MEDFPKLVGQIISIKFETLREHFCLQCRRQRLHQITLVVVFILMQRLQFLILMCECKS
jgi:hypothetical protein